MKRLTTQITKNNETKTIYAMVDDKTAKLLEKADAQVMHEYIVAEHEQYLSELKETRRHQSLDLSLENGHEFEDEESNLEEKLIKDEMYEEIHKAISTLSKEQQWLLYEVYFKGQTIVSVAKKFGVSHVAILNRLEKIHKKIKKFFI